MVDKIKELEIGGHTGREFQIFKLFTWININIVDDIDRYIFFSFFKKKYIDFDWVHSNESSVNDEMLNISWLSFSTSVITN